MEDRIENAMTVFSHQNFGSVRVVRLNGKPWFYAADVARALGYSDPSGAVNRHCKKAKYFNLADNATYESLDFSGRISPPKIIPESDVYRLILRSNLPTAEEFQDWVVEDVLPSINEQGSYSLPRPHDNSIGEMNVEFDHALDLAKKFGIDGNAALIAANNIYRRVHGLDLQKLTGATHLLAAKKEVTLTPTEIGSMLVPDQIIGPSKVNKILEQMGFQTPMRDKKKRLRWLLTEEGRQHAEVYDVGREHSDGAPVKQVKWYDSVVELIKDSGFL